MQNATQTFQLATNYRSHAGIVNCAHSVIERITKFWPYSIDTLSREIGIVDGLKPVFLNGWDTDNVRYVRLKSLFKLFNFDIASRNNFFLEQGDNDSLYCFFV
jgi:superfamily I DNA/RNA helicase